MRLLRLSVLLFSLLLVAGCGEDDLGLPVTPTPPTTDELMIADCHVVQDALEAFAEENSGQYPWRLDDQSTAGNKFVTFLPEGKPLTNRYTGLATAPVFHNPQWPGEIGVMTFGEIGDYTITGYRIIGRGRTNELVMIENLSAVSQQAIASHEAVIANCNLVVAAVEQYEQEAGWYPGNIGAHATPSGKVLSEFLAGGLLLRNPFSGYLDSPSDGNATTDGQIGYSPVGSGYSELAGYSIDGSGSAFQPIVLRSRDSPEDEQTRISMADLNLAVERFVSQNGGQYPRDIDVDATSLGKTVLDLLPYQYQRPNAYTGARALRNGLASLRGDVGYLPVENGGDVVGYVINGWGLFDELGRIEKPAP